MLVQSEPLRSRSASGGGIPTALSPQPGQTRPRQVFVRNSVSLNFCQPCLFSHFLPHIPTHLLCLLLTPCLSPSCLPLKTGPLPPQNLLDSSKAGGGLASARPSAFSASMPQTLPPPALAASVNYRGTSAPSSLSPLTTSSRRAGPAAHSLAHCWPERGATKGR